jgi:non-specific serine/threonine protein kinase
MPTRAKQLPDQAHRLLGRHAELSEAERLLMAHRQLTITGPGGCGKTWLAMGLASHITEHFAGRVYLIELAPVVHPSNVTRAVATALGVSDADSDELAPLLSVALAPNLALLVLDNCEHVLGICASLVSWLLAGCPQLHILVTSRESLGLAGEVVEVIPGLPYPATGANEAQILALGGLLQYEAVQLFLERAWERNPSLDVDAQALRTIGRICNQLEGLPLAIDLAAASTTGASLEDIAEQLLTDLHPLSSDDRVGPGHHRSLVAALDWSYRLLGDRERFCFRQLAIFMGGWSAEGATWVCNGRPGAAEVGEVLAVLARKSLIEMQALIGEPRYRMLEPVRQYALMQLQRHGELAQARERHLAYFAQLAGQVAPELIGAEQRLWGEQLSLELANLHAAMDRAIAMATSDASAERAITALHIPTCLERFWSARGRCREGAEQLTRALVLPGAALPAAALARAFALNARAALQCNLGLDDTVRVDLQQALAIAEAAGDVVLELISLRNLGTIAVLQGDMGTGEGWLRRGLALKGARGPAAEHSIAWSWLVLGSAAYMRGDDVAAEDHYGRAVECLRSQGDTTMLALSVRRLGQIALRQGSLQRAAARFAESLALNIFLSSPNGIAAAAGGLAGVMLGRAQASMAAQLLALGAAVLATTRDQMISIDHDMIEAHLAEARARLEARIFKEIWTRGCTMAPEQATLSIAEIVAGLNIPSSTSIEQRVRVSITPLTPREREVAVLIAYGRSNREIARALSVEIKTIEAHVTRVIGKLGVGSRVHVATWVLEQGLMSPQSPAKHDSI